MYAVGCLSDQIPSSSCTYRKPLLSSVSSHPLPCRHWPTAVLDGRDSRMSPSLSIRSGSAGSSVLRVPVRNPTAYVSIRVRTSWCGQAGGQMERRRVEGGWNSSPPSPLVLTKRVFELTDGLCRTPSSSLDPPSNSSCLTRVQVNLSAAVQILIICRSSQYYISAISSLWALSRPAMNPPPCHCRWIVRVVRRLCRAALEVVNVQMVLDSGPDSEGWRLRIRIRFSVAPARV